MEARSGNDPDGETTVTRRSLLASGAAAVGSVLAPSALGQSSTEGQSPTYQSDGSVYAVGSDGDVYSIDDSESVSVTVAASGTAGAAEGGDAGIGEYVDRVPGDELGVAAVASALGLGGLYLAARRRSGSRDAARPPQSTSDGTTAATVDGQGSAPAPTAGAASSGRTHPVAGTDARFTDFDLGKTIGSGRLTEVRKATHGPTGADVAIEALWGANNRTLARTLLDRFEAGVDTWSRLDDHPNVVSVLASGTKPIPWVALERCSEPLSPDAVSALSFESTRDLLTDVLEGLNRGHRQGQYHGAVTPHNVMVLSTDPDDRTAVVGDWLVAAPRLDESLAIADVYPHFAAPEQVDPDGEPDARTDVYQAGVLAHALLTGEYPVADAGETYAGDDPYAVEVPAAALPSDLPDAVADILATALAADPNARYQTALHFRDALEHVS